MYNTHALRQRIQRKHRSSLKGKLLEAYQSREHHQRQPYAKRHHFAIRRDRLEESVGGSRFAASTVQDLGFQPTLGATQEAKPKKAREKRNAASAAAFTDCGVHDRSVEGVPDCRVVGEGVAGAGVAGAGVTGARVAGAGRQHKKRWASHFNCP